MGILTNLLDTAWREQDARRQEEQNRYATIAQIPGIRPEIQEWAIDQLVKTAPKSAPGIKDIGGLFKGLIKRGGGDQPGMAGFQQALASTGRPGMTTPVPAGPTVPGASIPASQGTEGQPAAPAMNFPGGSLANVLPGGQAQVGPVQPSLMLSPQEQLNLKLDEFKQTEKVRNDLNVQMQDFLNQQQLEKQQKQDEAQTKELQRRIDLFTPVYGQQVGRDMAFTSMGLARPEAAATAVAGVIPGTDPKIQAYFKSIGQAADPKKYYRARADSQGNITEAFETVAPSSASEQLTTQVKTAIQSLRLAHPNWTDDQIKSAAGRQVQAQIGSQIEARELNLAVDRVMAEMAGIPTPGTRGAGTAPPRATNAPAPPGTPAVSNRVGGIETAPIRPGSDDDLKNQYISQILNPISGGRNKFTNVAYMKGRNLLIRDTGLTPYALDAAIQTHKGTAKSLQAAIQNEGGFERLGNAMGIFGQMLEEARNKVGDTGVTVLNRWLQNGMKAVPGDPDVGRLDVAFNAFVRTYTQVLSGGWQSRAMPPVANAEEARKLLGPEIQKGRLSAMIDQMQLETKGERQAIEEQKKGLYDDLKRPFGEEFSPSPRPTSAPAPATPRATVPGTAAPKKPKTASEWLANDK